MFDFRHRIAKEEWRAIAIAVAFVVAFCVYTVLKATAPGGALVSGIVVSSGVAPVARVEGAAHTFASVRLSNGNIVLARIRSGTPISAGTLVELQVQPRLLGGLTYEVRQAQSR